MDTKQVILELRTKKGMSQDELAEKVFGKLSGSFTLGKNGRNSSEYGNIEIAVKSIRCFYKYTFRLTEKAYLPMLRNAA